LKYLDYSLDEPICDQCTPTGTLPISATMSDNPYWMEPGYVFHNWAVQQANPSTFRAYFGKQTKINEYVVGLSTPALATSTTVFF
jgi:hypothetical protein